MKKILFIIDVVDSGGVSIVLQTLLDNLNEHKYAVDILTFEKNPEYESVLPARYKVRHVFKKNPARHANKLIRYMYLFGREYVPKFLLRAIGGLDQYDIVIDFKGNNLNMLAAAKERTVYWNHKDYSPESNPIERHLLEHYSRTLNGRLKERHLRRNLQKIKQIVCVSESMSNGFIKRWGFVDKTFVIYNVLNSERIRRLATEAIRYERGSTPVFCCMSRITSGKGIERLLECVSRLNAESYAFELIIVGGGDTLDDMIKLSKDMRLPNVSLLGHKKNPYPYVAASDVFVCPSETEAYSTVLCESIILGKPIIMTNVGSAEEIMQTGEYGMLVKSNQQAIYEAMKKFLDHPELISRYTRNPQDEIPYFDLRNRMEKVEGFLDE